MPRTPLEQLASLNVYRSKDEARSSESAKPRAEMTPQKPSNEVAFERLVSRLGPVLTDSVPLIENASLSRDHLHKFWDWAQRDLEPDLIAELNEMLGADNAPSEREFDNAVRNLVSTIAPLINGAQDDDELKRRLTIQIGGHDVFETVEVLLMVVNYLPFIQSGYMLASELNTAEDVETFSYALEHSQFPSDETKKFWCVGFVAGVAKIELLANAIAAHIFDKNDSSVRSTGYGEYVDAFIIEAQKQIEVIERQSGIFRDVDLICRAISRFHHVARCLQFNLDLPKSTLWVRQLEQLTSRAASALNSRFGEVVSEVNKVLRPAHGTSRTSIDPSEVLQAYNGLYILAATRAARESLALNAAVERAWREVGRALEVMVDRIFDHYKLVVGSDPFAAAQVDVAIKFCSIRFGDDYAAVLKRNKLNIEQRAMRQQVTH